MHALLAKELGAPVQGANNFVWIYSDGNVVIAPTNQPGVDWSNYTNAAGDTGPNLNKLGDYNVYH